MTHYLLFSGHMIDAPGRLTSRFPEAKEAAARKAIHTLLQQAKSKYADKRLTGIAGGACGGDIIFHEVCYELDIPSTIYLTLVPEEFQETSVSFAGEQWVKRFRDLLKLRPSKILPPAYLIKQPDIWEATNEWMIAEACKNGSSNMSLVVLWDREEGDGKGGTAHMVQVAEHLGSAVSIADMNTL
jgi:hypothetical protein